MARRSFQFLCIVLALCTGALAEQRVSGRNAFTDGNLENIDANGDPLPFRIQGRREFRLVEEGGNHWLRITNSNPKGAASVGAKFRLDPKWSRVAVSARLKAENLRMGKEGWQNARLQLRFEDEKNQMVGRYGPCPSLSADSGWRTETVVQDVPEGAYQLSLSAGLFLATGVMGIDDIRIVPTQPPEEKLHWGEEPVEVLSSKRARMCLNGLWRFVPAVGPAERAPGFPPGDSNWGYIRVPGAWNGAGDLPGIVARGRGGAWKGFDGRTLAKAWYEREVRIPSDWRGRAILARLGRVSTDAVVYANGNECSRIEWPYGQADITDAVKPGQKATLRILVVAAGEEGKVQVFMGPNQVHTTEAKLASRGIIGDVFLTSRPKGAHVSDVFVRTSTRKKELRLDVELTGVERAGRVSISARIFDEKGRKEKDFRQKTNVDAVGEQVVTCAWNWPDPRLWDVGQPNLYTLRIEVRGSGLDDEYAERFGFRELWIEGRKFFLNGTEVRFRPTVLHDEKGIAGTVELIDGAIDGFRWAGFDILELWPRDHDERGCIHFRELWVERADLKGWPMMAPALSMTRLLGSWNKPGVKDTWERRMARELRRYRNHPSVLIWAAFANRFGHGDDQNPRRIGRKDWIEDANWRKRAEIGEEACRLVKKHDPTRPVLVHQGGPVGDVYALNNYLCLAPLQEREEWLSHWASRGDMPYMVVEFGTPLHCTFMRGRRGGGWGRHTGATYSEPLMTEFCAVYLGREAYELETPEYRARVRERLEKGQMYKNWQGNRELDFAPANQKLQHLFSRNTYRSWRTMGVTGGMIPWGYGHGWDRYPPGRGETDIGPFEPARRGTYFRKVPDRLLYYMTPKGHGIHPGGRGIMEANGPTLAWITGPAGAWPAKDNSFSGGQRVRKQAAVLNDTRRAAAFSLSWEVSLAGRRVDSGSERGRIETGKTLFVPFEFTAPAVAPGGKVDGEVRLDAKIGDRNHKDNFRFRVFGEIEGAGGRKVAVFDPVGETTKMLRLLGFEVAEWRGEEAVPLLVIGRKVLSEGHELPARLETFVRRGGRAIVFAQEPEWMRRNSGLRASRHVTRRVFRIDERHPVVKGLDEVDLMNWNGSSDLVEPYPLFDPKVDRRNPGGAPYWGWHWGNRGAVASAAVEKPHLSSWRPILECEFDLAYTPLMELDYCLGRLVWCTLDLEEHVGIDPAARRLALNLMRYAREAAVEPCRGVAAFIGGERGKSTLQDLGLCHSEADRFPSGEGLAVIGPDARFDELALTEFIRGGGRALFLPRRKAEAALGVVLKKVDAFVGSLDVPAWPECRGLSASDLRWRAPHPAWIVASGCEIDSGGLLGAKRIGEGVAVFCQNDPTLFDTEVETFYRYTRWRQTRTLTQLLANLGAGFTADSRIFRPAKEQQVWLSGPWRAKITKRLPPSPDIARPHPDPGITAQAKRLVGAGADDSAWGTMELPALWEGVPGWEGVDGEAVFRREFAVPERWLGQELVLSLGAIDDFDDTFVNGVKVGRTDGTTKNFWSMPRVYRIPAELLRRGRNVVAVRVFDHFGGGGFAGERREMFVRPVRDERQEGLYHSDYRDDFDYGDEPYRYWRW